MVTRVEYKPDDGQYNGQNM